MAKSMKLHSCYSYFRNMSHSRPFQTQNNGKATFEIAGKYSHSDTVCHSQLQWNFCKKYSANMAHDSGEPTATSALPVANRSPVGGDISGMQMSHHGESHVQCSPLVSDSTCL